MIAAAGLLLFACAGSSYRHPEDVIAAAGARSDPSLHAFNLPEAAADEAVILINNNSGCGTHSSLLVVQRLSDRTGNYFLQKSFEPGWEKPTLRDYVEHQMIDGLRVQIFRCKLNPADIRVIEESVAKSGFTVPLNCAFEVRDEIAHLGPFKALKPTGWLSPNALTEALLPLVEGPSARRNLLGTDPRLFHHARPARGLCLRETRELGSAHRGRLGT